MAPRIAERLRAGRLDHAEERAARARSVVALGPAAVPAVLDALLAGRFDGIGGKQSDASLQPGEREVLEEVVRTLGRAQLPSFLELARQDGEPDLRVPAIRRALEVLSHCGLGRELAQALALAQELDSTEPLAQRLQIDLERAVRRIAQRDASALRLGVELLDQAPEDLAAAIVRGLASSEQARALQTLAQELAGRPELRGILLSQLAQAARSASQPIEPWIYHEVRRYLASDDAGHVRAATGAAAALWDYESLPLLIALLAAEPNVAREARSALAQLAGRDLGPEAASWSKWLDAERTWSDRNLPRIRRELSGGDPGQVVLALRELGGRTYRRPDLARLVEPCLVHAAPGVRKSACESLSSLALPSSAPLLVALLEDPDLAVARAAQSALVAVTGRQLPPEAPAWRAALGLGR